MWIINTDGFFSVVADKENNDRLVVRTRKRTDLQVFIDTYGTLNSVQDTDLADLGEPILYETPTSDYTYRCYVTREVWAEYVSGAALSIDYPNFKSEMSRNQHRNVREINALHAVWAEMLEWQDKLYTFDEYGELEAKKDVI